MASRPIAHLVPDSDLPPPVELPQPGTEFGNGVKVVSEINYRPWIFIAPIAQAAVEAFNELIKPGGKVSEHQRSIRRQDKK